MKRERVLTISRNVAVLLVAVIYGFLIGKLQFPPYAWIRTAYEFVLPKEIPKEHLETPREYTETDVPALISIHEVSDVAQRREELIQFLWGEPGRTDALPAEVVENWSDPRYDDVPSLQRIDKLVISMEFGLESVVYHFLPKKPNTKVVLYHQGHDGDFIKSRRQIGRLIENGYAVMGLCMPLKGLNNQPTVDLPGLGKLKLTTHDHMKFLRPKHGHPIRYFLDPVVIVLNYLERNCSYGLVSMVGISGGGWTTTVAAAADTRIGLSVPVAGTLPLYLRSNAQGDWGDYEQNDPDLYSTVNYLDLYILGSVGIDRKQLQVINQFDPCCFPGKKWETYKDVVRERVRRLGSGEFDLFLDDSHKEHTVSDVTMTRILEELGTR